MNTETGRVSDVDYSLYAEEAALAARSIDEYETRLLPLFMNYMQRFPSPTCIDEQLDQMLLYDRILSPQYQADLTPMDLEVISKVLTTFEQSNNFTRTDLLELRQLGIRLYNAYKSQSDKEKAIYKEYYRIVALQKIHKFPTDEAALNELKHFTQRLVRESDPEVVIPRLSNMRRTYGEEMFLSTLNGTDYLNWLFQLLKQAGPQQLSRVWIYLGPYIRLDQQSQDMLLLSLNAFGQLWNEKRNREGSDLFDAINKATAGREQEVLRLAVEKYDVLPDNTLQRFYCKLVYPMELDRRVPYRAIVQTVYADISVLELRYEIGKAGAEKGLDALERWINHAKQQRMPSLDALIYEGLAYLQAKYPQQWYDLAPSILTSKVLEPLPQHWEDHLVDTALSRVSLSRFTPTDIQMCKKYKKRTGLSEETRTVIEGLLAMESGYLDKELATRLRKHFVSLSPEKYHAEADSFVRQFLMNRITKDAHNLMVAMIFLRDNSDDFWQPYWKAFTINWTQASTAEQAADLLSFWYTTSPGAYTTPYIVQYFFYNLPQKLEEAQKIRGSQDVVRYINSLPEKQKPAWYPLLQDYLSGRKNMFASVGQNLAQKLQKHLVNQNAEDKEQVEQRVKEEYQARVATLFDNKKICLAHRQKLVEIYQWEQRELFWATYWEYFTAVLLSREADVSLELLAFWFDELHQIVSQDLTYSFFLGLSATLEGARKERGFREKARQISVKGMKYNQAYPWYGIVHEYFVEQERGLFPFFKRS